MTPEQIDRVFGRGRLRMVTGEHVEVFREAVAARRAAPLHQALPQLDRRRLRALDRARMAHPRAAHRPRHRLRARRRAVRSRLGARAAQLVQTYDAGVTVDQWATLLPLERDGRVYRHAFEDCAHWWALAHHCLVALKEIHELQLVHLDIKGDNVCIPFGPRDFDPDAPGHVAVIRSSAQLALIDFAFSLVSRESLTAPLPIGWQQDYDYQSPRLLEALEAGHDGDLRPTRELDWRCDIYSLAAMLEALPAGRRSRRESAGTAATGWTGERYDAAKALILTLRDHHDRDAPQRLPHQTLIDTHRRAAGASATSRGRSTAGWTLARDVSVAPSRRVAAHADDADRAPDTRVPQPARARGDLRGGGRHATRIDRFVAGHEA